jgi:hypothetical protein
MDTVEITLNKYNKYEMYESIKDHMICGAVYEIPE